MTFTFLKIAILRVLMTVGFLIAFSPVAQSAQAQAFHFSEIDTFEDLCKWALHLKEKGKNVVAFLDLDGLVTFGREHDAIHVNSLDEEGKRTGEPVFCRPEWKAHYLQHPVFKDYQGLLPSDLTNQHLREDSISRWIESMKAAGILVIAVTGRCLLPDEQVGSLNDVENWLEVAAQAKDPSKSVENFKKSALEKIRDKYPKEEMNNNYVQEMLSIAAARSKAFEELSGVRLSDQAGLDIQFAIGGLAAISKNQIWYTNGIAYTGYNKRIAILRIIEELSKVENLVPKPITDIVFGDDDIRTIRDFSNEDTEGSDYREAGITKAYIMHFPWPKALDREVRQE